MSTSTKIIPFVDSSADQETAIRLFHVVGAGIDRDDLDPDLLAFGLQHQLIREVLPTVPRGHKGPLPPVRIHLTGSALETSMQLRDAGHLLFGIGITRFGLNIQQDMTFEQWRGLIRNLRLVKECYHTALADGISYGRTRFGREAVDTCLQQLEFPFEDVTHAESIALVPRLTRETFQLTSEHTYILGLLLPQDHTSQEMWAARCQEHCLSPIALRRSIERGEIITDEQLKTISGANSGRPVLQGMTLQFSRWVSERGGVDQLLSLPREAKLEILQEVAPVVEIALKLRDSIED
jgi:hypothetical protein